MYNAQNGLFRFGMLRVESCWSRWFGTEIERICDVWIKGIWGNGGVLNMVDLKPHNLKAYEKIKDMNDANTKTRFEKMLFFKTGSLESPVADQSEPA